MTVVGAGGVVIAKWKKSRRFHKEYDRLSIEPRDRTDARLQDLVKNPPPPGLAFEKLKGYANPDIYTIHVTGNHKVSMEIEDGTAFLWRIATHDEIDLMP
ncbi:MAG: type II toxin-antitoxin system RelE/ParE family toxin [Candidatus Accumulibacter sp.]|jgi:mRNA-degrading endonuclease RelE of RelBE toxin-antitoxin system|nr:type II toxin-antitoxin system RelE/ParE family toxin [Accumulibacter sp.]